MPCNDDELPTVDEEIFLKKFNDPNEIDQRDELVIELKNRILGSNRLKIALYNVGFVDTLNELFVEYSSRRNSTMLIEMFICLSSLSKSNEGKILVRLVELNFIEKLLEQLSINDETEIFYGFCLRCLSSFYSSNVDRASMVKIFFDYPNNTKIFKKFFSTPNEIFILRILTILCVDEERSNSLFDQDLIGKILKILMKSSSNRNDEFIEISLKLICAASFQNRSLSQSFHDFFDEETKENFCEVVANFLTKIHRSETISLYASKFFVNLCKCHVLSVDDPFISILSLTTLIHLCTKPLIDSQSIEIHLESLKTLSDLLDGNNLLHHSAMYTEQFLRQLISFFLTANQFEKNSLIELRAAVLSLLAIFASHHSDIQKRIGEKQNLITSAIESYRSDDQRLKLAALRLFHGLSRSVDQLHTTFNEQICDILLDALKSNDLSLVKTSSCAISNLILEFSTCRKKLVTSGILETLLSFLSHSDSELAFNSVWALRNLAYSSTLEIKEDIIKGLTVDRIYTLLEKPNDDKFFLCFVSLLRNLLHEKDRDEILPLFNVDKLNTILDQLLEKSFPEKLRSELNLLLDQLKMDCSRTSGDSVNSSCRPFLFPEYTCDEMDQLDCS